MPAEILKFTFVISKASIPPINAKGTLFNTNNASLIFPNRTNRIKKISIKLIGTAVDNLEVALC
ncbi:hypothetical protein D3C86_2052660 [compost metagenome]